jgi:DNA-binding MarR family transcriptional regulator
MDAITPMTCAGEVLDTVPLIMQYIRTEMRRGRGAGVSVPQFRVLTFLGRTGGASLSAVADRVGLSLPAMSRLVDGLVDRGLVDREESPEDRRRIRLGLTLRGKELVRVARKGTQSRVAEALEALPPARRAEVTQAMQILRPLFIPGPPTVEE